MALYLARERAELRDIAVEVDSAGTLGIEGREPPDNTQAVMREIGIPVSDHRSKGITLEHMQWADRVLVMTYEHAATLRERFPENSEHVELLGPFGRQAPEIDDPVGRWRRFHRKVRDQIAKAVDGLLARVERDAQEARAQR